MQVEGTSDSILGIQETELGLCVGELSLVVEHGLGDLVDDVLAQILGSGEDSLDSDADDVTVEAGISVAGEVLLDQERIVAGQVSNRLIAEGGHVEAVGGGEVRQSGGGGASHGEGSVALAVLESVSAAGEGVVHDVDVIEGHAVGLEDLRSVQSGAGTDVADADGLALELGNVSDAGGGDELNGLVVDARDPQTLFLL